MTTRCTALITLLALFAIPLAAEHGATQEKPSITLEGARRVIAAAVAEAKAKDAPGGVIAVVDDGGNLVALERLDNTFAAGANISIGKARTAALFRRPTRLFEEIIRNGRTPMVALNDFTPLQGGVPIMHDGQVIGGVGVSGAASAQQDEDLALAGAAAIPGSSSGAGMNGSVTYFEKERVKGAFAKGDVLVGSQGARNYMIHASRREKPGLAEVHARDTDIIYVLDGTATMVTGGSVVNGKPTEPGEVRGPSIQGGDTRTLSRGDVMVVPNGTPHWFQKVDGPFLYYVVKVR